MDARRLAPAALAALVAAVGGGILWGLIVKTTDYEIGFAAWGIGFIVGTATVLAARSARGVPFQVIAVVAALLGILLGKYLGFAWMLQDIAGEEGFDLGLFASETRTAFREELDTIFGWFDLLWAGLAVVTAWRIPQHEEPDAGERHGAAPGQSSAGKRLG